MKKTAFIWCDLQQNNKPLENCPRCKKFQCKSLTHADMEHLKLKADIELLLVKLTRRKVINMLFLIQENGDITAHKGTLESIPAKTAEKTNEVVEPVTYYYEQILTWVPKNPAKQQEKEKAEKKMHAIIERATGVFTLENIDVNDPDETITKIYPVKKTYERKYIQRKITSDTKTKKAQAGRKKAV